MSINSSLPPHALDLGQDMQLALDAASKAGTIIRENFGKIVSVEEKAYLGDLVCQVDKACDKIILETIRKTFSEDDILSEELSPDTKDKGQRLWVVDPMDGTAGFLSQDIEIPSVMIALRERYSTLLSVIFFPMTGEWFYAQKGGGAFKNGQKLYTSHVTLDLKEVQVAMNKYSDPQLETPEFRSIFGGLLSKNGAKRVFSIPPHSGIIKQILCGSLAAVVHDNGSKSVKQGPWDIIPAQLLLEQAGGVMLNLGNEVINPFKPETFVAAGNEEIAMGITALAQAKIMERRAI